MEATTSSDTVSNRRDERRSSPPPPGGPPSPSDVDADGEVERVMSTPDSLKVEHAVALRDLLERFAADYDLEEYLDRMGRPKAWSEGATAACAICADPGPVIAAFLSTLDTAIEHADQAEVDHE